MITLNGQPIHVTLFPDKTSQVWKLERQAFQESHARIEWKFEHEGEFMHLAQLVSLLKIEHSIKAISLHLPYLPYGRQDKIISNYSTFALRSFAYLINGLNFYQVSCVDPHSDVAFHLIDRFKPSYPLELIRNIYYKNEVGLLCYPDEGASLKYGPLLGLPAMCGIKERDQATGAIKSYMLHTAHDPHHEKVLIVDDICDGGATFVLLANELRRRNVSEIYLFVTHGIFSKGTAHLKEAGITRIYTKEGELTC